MAKLNYSKELQNKVVELYTKEHRTLKEIKSIAHLSFEKVKELLTLNGVVLPKRNTSKTITEDLKNQIIDLYTNQLMGCVKISKLIGVSEHKVEKIIHDAGIMNAVGKSKKYKCNSDYFENIDTEHKAYWLGVLYADGNVGSTRSTVTFSAKDKLWVNSFLIDLNSTNTVHEEIHKVYKTSIWKAKISDDKMKADLMSHGCVPQKSLILEFPELSKNLISHFIRGYFDGDGSVGVYNNSTTKQALTLRSSFCCGTELFLKKLCSYLPLKTKTINRQKKDNNGAGILYDVKFSVNDSISLYKYMYNDATIWLPRKRKIFEDFIKQRRSETIIEASLDEKYLEKKE